MNNCEHCFIEMQDIRWCNKCSLVQYFIRNVDGTGDWINHITKEEMELERYKDEAEYEAACGAGEAEQEAEEKYHAEMESLNQERE